MQTVFYDILVKITKLDTNFLTPWRNPVISWSLKLKNLFNCQNTQKLHLLTKKKSWCHMGCFMDFVDKFKKPWKKPVMPKGFAVNHSEAHLGQFIQRKLWKLFLEQWQCSSTWSCQNWPSKKVQLQKALLALRCCLYSWTCCRWRRDRCRRIDPIRRSALLQLSVFTVQASWY